MIDVQIIEPVNGEAWGRSLILSVAIECDPFFQNPRCTRHEHLAKSISLCSYNKIQ